MSRQLTLLFRTHLGYRSASTAVVRWAPTRPKVVRLSADFAEVERQQHTGDWDAAAELLVGTAPSLEAAGGDGAAVCSGRRRHHVRVRVVRSGAVQKSTASTIARTSSRSPSGARPSRRTPRAP